MQRLIDIKNMAIELDNKLNDPILVKEITNEYKLLKRQVEKEIAVLEKKSTNNTITEQEEHFIIPALNDAYFYTLDDLNVNAKPSDKMRRIVSDVPDRIDYWLLQIK